ncbi:MAG: PhzF family phenazine biosynthesis protein [Planctomycetes bacterium]|nr:PhzF family phenazine biosynthesis protein [Planctomycetota bacterium]
MPRLFLVDAFADRAFTGNPAAVCVLDRQRPDDWMQSLAAEMNQSETAFLLPDDLGWHLRWMTPLVEVDLCGHATLAAAHVLWETGIEEKERSIHFRTRSGDLVAWHVADDVEMNFPRTPVEAELAPEDLPRDIADALGVRVLRHGRNARDRLVEVDSERTVREVAPDLRALAAAWRGGLIVTARSSDARWDFVSRFFAPGMGVDEDPVTGSAHCALGPWWQQRLGKDDLTGYQASRRGGVVRVRVTEDRCYLRGRAVMVTRGELAD